MRDNNSCSMPANNADYDGIYRYLSWLLHSSGQPSYAISYLEAMCRAAKNNDIGEFVKTRTIKVDRFRSKPEVNITEDRARVVLQLELPRDRAVLNKAESANS